MRLLESRFNNIEDEIAHIIIAIASSANSKNYFNRQIRDLYSNYDKSLVDNCITEHVTLINRLIGD